MVPKVREFWSSIRPYRKVFGPVAGARLGLALRRSYTLPPGTLFPVIPPGWPAPVWLRAGTSDGSVFRQIVGEAELDFPGVGPGVKLIVDAGANVGVSSAWLSLRHPSATVVALEVEPGNLAVLRRTAERFPRVKVVAAGLWSSRARLRIANPDAACWSFQTVEAPAGPIPAVGVSDLVAEYGPIDLLKIDIEGGEVDALGSSDSWIGSVRVLAVELHDRFRPGCRAALDHAVAGQGFVESRRGEYVIMGRY